CYNFPSEQIVHYIVYFDSIAITVSGKRLLLVENPIDRDGVDFPYRILGRAICCRNNEPGFWGSFCVTYK
ncbi:hypothetical protein RSW97_26540, partial [Escherichia coli]|nr:hypothetical protein [Escherichia coli]